MHVTDLPELLSKIYTSSKLHISTVPHWIACKYMWIPFADFDLKK